MVPVWKDRQSAVAFRLARAEPRLRREGLFVSQVRPKNSARGLAHSKSCRQARRVIELREAFWQWARPEGPAVRCRFQARTSGTEFEARGTVCSQLRPKKSARGLAHSKSCRQARRVIELREASWQWCPSGRTGSLLPLPALPFAPLAPWRLISGFLSQVSGTCKMTPFGEL